MKKLFLLAVILMFITGCGSEKSENEKNDSSTSQTTSTFERTTNSMGEIVITEEEFNSYLTEVDITADNFFDYYELKVVEFNNYNAFGEIADTRHSCYYVLKLDSNCYVGCVENFAYGYTYKNADEQIESGDYYYVKSPAYYNEDNQTIEARYFNGSEYTVEEYSADEFKITRAKGKLQFLANIPEEVINTKNSRKTIAVDNGDCYMLSEEGTFIPY